MTNLGHDRALARTGTAVDLAGAIMRSLAGL